MPVPLPSADPVIGGNLYPKYTTRNPIARRLVDNFLARLRALVRAAGAREIHEVGCGEGHLSMLLASDGLQLRGCDLSPDAIAAAWTGPTAGTVQFTGTWSRSGVGWPSYAASSAARSQAADSPAS